ncbi:hypothetical protein Tco_0359663 [Tanacetum coccineum]
MGRHPLVVPGFCWAGKDGVWLSVSGALSPVHADLIPSPKRVKDSGFTADVEVWIPGEISLRMMLLLRFDETEAVVRGPVEVKVRGYASAMPRIFLSLLRRSSRVRADTALTERDAEYGGDSRRLRAPVVRRCPNTRSERPLTPEEVEELITRRVAESDGRLMKPQGPLKPLNENEMNKEVEMGVTRKSGKGGTEEMEMEETEKTKWRSQEPKALWIDPGLTKEDGDCVNISNCPPKNQVKYALLLHCRTFLNLVKPHKRTIGVDFVLCTRNGPDEKNKWKGLLELLLLQTLRGLQLKSEGNYFFMSVEDHDIFRRNVLSLRKSKPRKPSRNKNGNKLEPDWRTVDGRISRTNIVLRVARLGLLGHPFYIDLMPEELGSFDIIIGGSKLNIKSCAKTKKYMYKDVKLYLAQVTSKKAEDKVGGEATLRTYQIVRELSWSLSRRSGLGYRMARQVEFQIDLVPGAAPVHEHRKANVVADALIERKKQASTRSSLSYDYRVKPSKPDFECSIGSPERKRTFINEELRGMD